MINYDVRQKWHVVAIFVVSLLLFGYTTYRAQNLSFTYDESTTVLEYAWKSYHTIFLKAPTATNHVLNTALVKLSSSIFPKSEFVFRLPNVLAHLIYMFFSALLVMKLKNVRNAYRVLGFILLNANPYMLDFFSLARGYGLALSFTMAALYYWHGYSKSWSSGNLAACLLFSALAVLSNFSLLNLYLGISALFVLNTFFQFTEKNFVSSVRKQVIIFLSVSILLFLLISLPLHELITTNELFFGGQQSVWNDTIMSLLSKSVYEHDLSENSIRMSISVFGFMLSVILVGFGFQSVLSRRNLLRSFGFQLFLLVLLILLGLTVQNLLFNTRYIIERTALFLLPMFLLMFIFSISEIQYSVIKIEKLKLSVVGIITIVMLYNTLSSINTTYFLDWKYEEHSKELMQEISNEERAYETYFGVNWPYIETCRFYKYLYDYSWLRVVGNPASLPWGDGLKKGVFYSGMLNVAYVTESELQDLPVPEKTEVRSDNMLLVHFTHPKIREYSVTDIKFDNQKNIVNGELYLDLFYDSVPNPFKSDSMFSLRIEVGLEPMKENFTGNILCVLEIDGEILKTVAAERIPSWDNRYRVKIVHRYVDAASSKLLRIYLHNQKRENFKVEDFNLIILGH